MKEKGYICANCGVRGEAAEKEPELMTLQEAVKKANDNDLIKHSIVIGLEFLKGHYQDYHVSVFRAIEKKWQIIPAEPKVLNAEECWSKIAKPEKSTVEKEAFFYLGFEYGEKQQWLKHHELRLAAETVLKAFIRKEILEATNCENYFDALHKSLKNLKPLEAE